MKKIVQIIPVLLTVIGIHAKAAPVFLDLQSNLSTYTVNQNAILTAKIKIQPANPSDEIFLTAAFNNNTIKITRVSDDQAVTITPALTAAGTFAWQVNAYIQDKAKARGYEAAMIYYQAENIRINAQMAKETDLTVRANLQAQMDRNNLIVGDINNQLWASRRQIESRTLQVTVNAPSTKMKPLDSNPVIAVDCDSESQTYKVGDTATFYVHALTQFNGPDGVQEIVAGGDILGDATHTGISTEKKRLGDSDFSFVAPTFQAADVGTHIFRSYIQIRSKAQADSIRNTIAQAAQTKARYIAIVNGANDPMTQAYYNQLIADLETTMNELARQLQDMLTTVGPAKDLYFNVTQ